MTFIASLDRYSEKMKKDMEAVARRLVLDVGTALVMRSPVGQPSLWRSPAPPGYVGGRFRANWQHGYNKLPSGDLPDIDKTGAVSLARIRSGVSQSPAAGIHFLTNNLPYAQRIEDGWSHTQAPQGVVQLTLIEFSK